ncbi:MAG: DUF4838 domain-containing protein [Victivallales bacterium]|nr:DUF4838 domain-containing protein [Victivallales bacterium]
MRLLSIITLACAGALLAQSYAVKGPASPKPHESTAMKELTDYLARRINGKLTIGGASPVTFQVGDTELAKQNKCLSTELPEEKWVIKSVGDQIILNGGGTRGALYATYHFLEDYCDVHWWNDFEDYVPTASSLTLPKLDASGKPAFLYRDIYRFGAANPKTSIRNRLNRCGDVPVPAALGGSFNYGPPYHCHTFDKYVPVDKYFKDHPEYFSLVNGRRVGGQDRGQLCLTNPELKKIFLENLLLNIKEGDELAKKNGVPAPRIYEVSMNDNHGKCDCDNCKAEAEKYNQSGLYLNFVNWLAAEVKKTHPDVYISTLAYFYTEPPPKGGVRAADNVVVKLCDTKTNQASSIFSPENKVFFDFVAQWKGFAKHLFIWDYAITFTHNTTGLPFASEFHYGDLYRYYLENNVSGVFWEHEEPHKADLYELKFFVETKLFEDPYQDVNKLIALFMDRYYGAAAPFVLEYRKLIDKARKDNEGFVSWFPSEGSFMFITDENIAECQALFDKAEKAVAGDKTLTARVRHARCGLDRLTCSRTAPLNYHGTAKNEGPAVKLDVTAAANRQIVAWADWCRNFPNGEKLAEAAANSLKAYSNEIKLYPAPEQFKDRNFYDFYCFSFEVYNKESTVIVKDPESPVESATRIDVSNSHYYLPPFAVGYYDQGRANTVLNTSIKPSQEPGYHWYCAGKVKIQPNGYVYVTRAWTTKLQTGRRGLVGNEYEIWFSAKFTGPKYINGQDGQKDYIYIDRMLLVEPK